MGDEWGHWQCCGCELLLAMGPLVLLALTLPGKSNCWVEEKMFAMNKQLKSNKTTATLMKRGLMLQARDAWICMPSG